MDKYQTRINPLFFFFFKKKCLIAKPTIASFTISSQSAIILRKLCEKRGGRKKKNQRKIREGEERKSKPSAGDRQFHLSSIFRLSLSLSLSLSFSLFSPLRVCMFTVGKSVALRVVTAFFFLSLSLTPLYPFF